MHGKGEEEARDEALIKAVVYHSGAGVVLYCTSGTRADVVVHRSGAGMVEGVLKHRDEDGGDSESFRRI